MNIFLVFDSRPRLSDFSSLGIELSTARVTLFPLTSDKKITDDVMEYLSGEGCEKIVLLDSAREVDDTFKALRTKFIELAYGTAKIQVKGKSLKEWLLIPGSNVSTWWFSLLSEKNPLKTNAYLQISQTHAIKSCLASTDADLCVSALANPDMKAVMKLFKTPVACIRVHGNHPPMLLKQAFYNLLRSTGILFNLLGALWLWMTMTVKGILARRKLPSVRERLPQPKSLAVLTHFPHLDSEMASKGIFANLYLYPLQKLLRDNSRPILWLLNPASINGYGYRNALKLARKLSKEGEKLFILYEFLTVTGAIKALALWIRQSLIGLTILRKLPRAIMNLDLIEPECYPIIKSFSWTSQYGGLSIEPILYYLIFLSFFEKITNVDDCLYLCEMHAWEKALNAARNTSGRQIRTIAFQHTAISHNYLHYFYHKEETQNTSDFAKFPMPDVVAANGRLMHSFLSESGFPCVTQVEAVRQFSIRDLFHQPFTKSFVLLVVGSYSKAETTRLVTLAHDAFLENRQFEIWFKGHPGQPIKEIVDGLDISQHSLNYKICQGTVYEHLPKAHATLVSSSAVTIEALKCGSEVIIPLFPDSLTLAPLAEFTNFYHQVTCPKSLQKTCETIMCGAKLYNVEAVNQFIDNYWNLDVEMPLWRKLLLPQ